MEAKKPISHVVAGLLIAGIVIALSMVMMLMTKNAAGKPGSGWITYVIIIGALVFFINQFGKANHFQLGFGELFSYGFKATAMYTIVFVGFLILFSVLFPDFKNNAIEAARTQMETQKGASEEQMEKGMQIMEKYFWPIAIGGTTLAFVIIGAIGSLIGAAVTKKRPQNPFDQLPQ